MLDIALFRDAPETIKASEKRRGKDPNRVDTVRELDQQWRETHHRLDGLRHEKNTITDEIGAKKQAGEDASEAIARVAELNATIDDLEEREATLRSERNDLRYEIGNLVHESVPDGTNENDNVPVEHWEPTEGKKDDAVLGAELLERNNLVETEKAVEVAGERAYYLKGDLVRLAWALQQFAMDLLVEQDYLPVQTPYYLNEAPMEAAAELDDFREQLYKLERHDRYLIATAEQPLAALQYDEILEAGDLPLKYAGFSTNFRREAGKHGTQTRGLWRVHQFEKIEQFIFADPADSWEIHGELLENAEAVMQALDLPYRVVNVCTGDLGDTAAKKFDIEVWRPPLQEYGEVVSCSNCTSYQARKLNARIRRPGEENETVHTLNATALVPQRIITAIVENNQTNEGIVLPTPLHEYLGKEVIEVQSRG
ncbi:seryl-tRNA synthetase [Haladaptatus litoreus]|uniref:Serine--tRNA ligase n=1 Tax=Haladaptatus litoreus TaxID=553468 RepID=A0A1N7EXP4_9EURY|nr:serine--tRNA ligase [Haladaptatus litoreus]SIR92839.1 seryl-tRNA synthetase [Haladaptatus litoreus]